MLSDSIHEIREKLLKEISHYSDSPWDKSYPSAQKMNLVLALTHLDLAIRSFDSFEIPDDHTWSAKDRLYAVARATNEFDDAIQSNGDD